MKTLTWLTLALCVAAAHAGGGSDPWAANSGPLRIEGPREMTGVVQRWIAGFAKQHPQIVVQARLRGTDVGLGALGTGHADIALAGRDATAQEVKGFEWIYRYRPTTIDVMTGSLDHPGHSPALAVLVHRDNPLQAISVAQLERVFDAGPGARQPVWSRWGELGLGGSWAERPIHLSMPNTESGTGAFFRGRVLAGARALPWDRLTEIDDSRVRGASRHDAGRRLAQAVARDRDALAIAPLSPRLPAAVKVLPLAADGPAVQPSAESLVERRYALGRVVHAYVNAAPAQPLDAARAHPLDPRAALFLRYVLGPDGQHDIEADAQYLPLSAQQAVAQIERLR